MRVSVSRDGALIIVIDRACRSDGGVESVGGTPWCGKRRDEMCRKQVTQRSFYVFVFCSRWVEWWF